MRDAIELEWAGIPTVAIIHEALRGSADSMKRLSGAPEYPYVLVHHPHTPIAEWDAQEIRQIAQELAPRVAAMLTGNSA